MKSRRWKLVRTTKAGRNVERMTIHETSARNGVADWVSRRKLNPLIARFNPEKYSYSFTVTSTWRFEGKRRIFKARLEVTVKHPGTLQKKIEGTVARAFRKNPGRIENLRRGTFDVYQEIVQNLIMRQGAYLPGSEGWKLSSKKVKGGRVGTGKKNKGVYKRGLSVFKVGVEIERTRRKL